LRKGHFFGAKKEQKMKVLIDTTTYKHNTAAMHKIERESQLDADAAGHQANISDGSKNAYYTGYHVLLARIVRSYTEKIEKAVDYENGLFKWLYLDGNGQIVAETIGDAPLFELDDIKAAAAVR